MTFLYHEFTQLGTLKNLHGVHQIVESTAQWSSCVGSYNRMGLSNNFFEPSNTDRFEASEEHVVLYDLRIED